jgi:hypothetical protein
MSENTTEKRVTFDLKECPMVMDELVLVLPEKRTGALIVDERTGLPYRTMSIVQPGAGTRPPPASPARYGTAISEPAASLKVTRRGQAFLTVPG